ncbi:hypothetical protein JOF53_001162 [Crossiella equi]|uniref:BLUF domain-containing protein n=1 Tax=Crossiella equi TaxID=130796 RepID=A0ABS5A6R9_9PSEU|nr:BLUF domain-containing protein [Crossiella equi]MBP2472290.1 hypothetical protein [Crossiella equi]
MLHTLTYSSAASFVLSEREVTVLLARSRELNVADNITGLLVYLRLAEDRAAFVQVLEGDRDAVERTYARIEGDELHTDLRVLHRAETERRRFSRWSMKFARLDPLALPEVLAGAGDPLADRAWVERVIAAVAGQADAFGS